MKTSALLLLPLVLLGASGTPDPNTVSAMARHVPAEFAADAMIRVASNKKLDPRMRVKLLTEAFHRATGAQHPFKMRGSITQAGDTGGFLERAYQQDLDALSLRMRVVKQMLPLDGAKAAKLFLSVARPAVPAVHCEEIVVYDVNAYYEGLGAIVKLGRQSAASLLKGRVGGITSAAQIAPVARLLQQAGLSDSALQALTLSFASDLRKIGGDDRSFTYYAPTTGPAMLALVEELKSRHLDPLPLMEAYRFYLVRNLTADRCADGHLIFNGPITLNLFTGQPAEVLGWNAAKFFADNILMPPVQPLTEQETTPKSLEGFATGVHACVDPQCKHLDELSRNLVFNDDGRTIAESQKNTEKWRSGFQAELTGLEAWQPAKGHEEEVFRDKTWLYNNLYAMSHGAGRDRVVESWLAYLKQSRPTVGDRTQWFLPVSTLIGRSALDPSNTKLAGQLRAQDDPLIALYIEVEALAPLDAGKILTML